MEACVPSLPRNLGTAELLPSWLKSSILELATAKGLADEHVLEALLHRDTPTLSLGGVFVDDKILRVVSNKCEKLTMLNLSAFGDNKGEISTAGKTM